MDPKKYKEDNILKILNSLIKDGLVTEENVNGEKKYSLTMLGVKFIKNLQTKEVN